MCFVNFVSAYIVQFTPECNTQVFHIHCICLYSLLFFHLVKYRSSLKLILHLLFGFRFIPDDTTFDHEPKGVACEAPEASQFKPLEFQTTALTRSSVQLTWDENDKRRAKETDELFKSRKKMEEMESHIQAYLESSSEEEEEEEDEDGEYRVEGGKSLPWIIHILCCTL